MILLYLILALKLLIPSLGSESKLLKQTTQIQTSEKGYMLYTIIKDFDENENLIKEVYINYKQIPERTSYYGLDKKGRMITDSTYNENKELIEAHSYEYNEFDDVIKQKRLFVDRDAYHEENFEITYNSSGNIIELKQSDEEGELDWVYTYEYDNNGNEVKSISYFHGTIREEWASKYKNNILIEEKLYDYDNEELRRSANTFYYFEYDKKGKLILTTVHSVADYLAEKELVLYHHVYDKAGHEIEETRTKNGVLVSTVKTVNMYW